MLTSTNETIAMNKRTSQSLLAMALMFGGAAVQSAGLEQSDATKALTPIAPGALLADTQVEYGIRPVQTLGSALSSSPESGAPAIAQTPEPAMEPSSQIHTEGEIRYVSGGIGESERAELDALSSQFNLHLLFATQGSGEYLSAVQVNIADQRTGSVLDVESKGPWFFAQLPQGDYNLEVTPTGSRGHGVTQRKTVRIDASKRSRLDFYWKD
jgi:hypothetical protein